MRVIALGYWMALLRAAPLSDVVQATVRRLSRRGGLRAPGPASRAESVAAAEALARAPAWFPDGRRDARALHRLLFPDERERARRRAERILRHEIELFGAVHRFGRELDWHRDPRSGGRFDPTVAADEIDLLAPGPDPKLPWELARAAHLLELGVAATLDPDLAAAARAETIHTIGSFLDGNPVGRGVHWTSPLEAALRAVHWLAALELASAHPLPERIGRRIGGALVEHGRFLAANLEDRGVVAGNHLIGDLVGLLAIGVALDGAAEAPAWRRLALARLPEEARRQVQPDGSDFEASTAYHRFTLELLLAADRIAAAAGIDAGLAEPLHRMFGFVAGYLAPDGSEPGFGDGDDGRCLPLRARDARDHGYLLAVGATRFADPALKPPGARFPPEAAWLAGARGYRLWRALPSRTPEGPGFALGRRAASFPDGGVHVLRDGGHYVALRCGGYGQRGVGGHAHNDQLAVCVFLDGEPLVVDPGTHCYAADPLWRDRFRGTAAHSTVIVDGEEQSPLFERRPFALPDGAAARLIELDGDGRAARAIGEHHGYRRLASRVVHRREVRLDRDLAAVIVVDTLDGRGEAAAEARYHLGESASAAALSDELRERLRARAGHGAWGELRPRIEDAIAVARGGVVRAAIVPLGDTPAGVVDGGWFAPHYGARGGGTVVRFGGRGPLPRVLAVAMLSIEPSPARPTETNG